jgi:hypothetical protein
MDRSIRKYSTEYGYKGLYTGPIAGPFYETYDRTDLSVYVDCVMPLWGCVDPCDYDICTAFV